MNAEILKQMVIDHLNLPVIPENAKNLYVFAILDEICETITSQHPDKPLSELIDPTILAYHVGLSAFQGLVNASLQSGAGQATVNYRGQTFVFRAPLGQ